MNKDVVKITCKNCGVVFQKTSKMDSKRKFCSSSCAAKYNNKIIPKRSRSKKRFASCFNCHKAKENNFRKYCCDECMKEHYKNNAYEKAYKRLLSGDLSDSEARKIFRKASEHKCSVCGITKWNGVPAPLVVDHIDGNSSNNIVDNLRMICNNCDALSPTYCGKNKGNGRKSLKTK